MGNVAASLFESRKTWMALGGILAVLVVTLLGAVLGVSEEARGQAVEAIKWLVGFLIGGHAVTDVGHQLSVAVRDRPVAQVVQPVAQPMPPPPPTSGPPFGTDETERVTPTETPSAKHRLPVPPGGRLPGSPGGWR